MKVFSKYFILLALSCSLLLGGCKQSVSVTKSTVQQWHGGVEGSGGGKNYTVYCEKSKSAIVTFDKVWIGDNEKGWLTTFSVSPLNPEPNQRQIAPKGVKAFKLIFSEILPAQNPNFPNTITPLDQAPNDLPKDFDKGVAIFFHMDTKEGIWVLSDIEQLPTLNYP